MIGLVVLTVIGFTTGFTLQSVKPVLPSLMLHMIFAVGIVPLILGAMTYFTPVLTRTGSPTKRELIPPLIAFIAGTVLILSLWIDFRFIPAAVSLALVAVIWVSIGIIERRKRCLGTPHPCLIWYQAALALLILALLSILLGFFWPDQWSAFRRLHLHLNLLGFVGLTALATLRVLLPTTTGLADKDTFHWLNQQWRWMVPGILSIGLGSGWYPPLALFGALLLLMPLLSMSRSMLQTQWGGVAQLHGASPALGTAFAGFITCLLVSGLHIHDLMLDHSLTLLYMLIFMMPLVTGAASHLIPLWLIPISNPHLQASVKERLGRFAAIRCTLFISSGILLVANQDYFILPALIALVHFLSAIISSIFQYSRARVTP